MIYSSMSWKSTTKKWSDADAFLVCSRTKHVTMANTIPEVKRFPFAVQRMVSSEYMKVDDRVENGKETPAWITKDKAVCHCRFHRKYLLPCVHFFHAWRDDPEVLSEARWSAFASMFDELGYHVYLKTIAEDPTPDRNDALEEVQVVLDARDVGEVYQGMAFEFAEKIRSNPANKEDLMAQYNQLIAQTRRMSLNFLLLMRE